MQGAAGLRFFFRCVLFFWSCHAACRILTLGPGTESGRWPVKVLSPNRRTAKEFSGLKSEGDAKGQQGGKSENRLLWGVMVEGDSGRMLAKQPHSPALLLPPSLSRGEGVVQSAQTRASPACSTHYVQSAFLDLALSKLDES